MSEALKDFRAAAALDLMSLALLHDRELDADTITALQDARFPDSLALLLDTESGKAAQAVLEAAVAALSAHEPSETHELAADYAAIYLNHGYGASPCESVWIDEDGLAMQRPMFEVRRCYARYGLAVPDWRKRTDDHLVHQLEYLALLSERPEPDALSDMARFLDEHTLRWLPAFARRVAARAATPFYAGLAMLTAAYLDELRDILASILGETRPTSEQIEQRMRPQRETPVAMPVAYVPGTGPSW